MKFHPPPVRLLNHKLHRVVERRRSQSLLPGQKLRPGFHTFGIKRIGSGPHLHHHRVETGLTLLIEHNSIFGLLLFGGKTLFGRPVDIVHGSNPDRPKLAFGRRSHTLIKWFKGHGISGFELHHNNGRSRLGRGWFSDLCGRGAGGDNGAFGPTADPEADNNKQSGAKNMGH